MDNLMKSAKAFKALLKKEYIMTIGKKGKNINFKIIFTEEDFKHLSGIHKLYDLSISNMSAKKIFRSSLKGIITEEDLMKSKDYEIIKERIELLKNIEKYIDGNLLPFKWDNKKCVFKCDIIADFLMKENIEADKTVYLFLKESISLFDKGKKMKIDNIKKESAITIFKDSKDYSYLQEKYTLIKNIKVDLLNNKTKVLYDFEEEKAKKSNHIKTKYIEIEKMLIEAGYTPTERLMKDVLLINNKVKEIQSIKELRDLFNVMNKVAEDFKEQEKLEIAAEKYSKNYVEDYNIEK